MKISKRFLPELLAPAGDLEKLKIAFLYGADAVYAGVPDFGMRVKEIGFDLESLAEGVRYTHDLGKKIYITVNIFAKNDDIAKLPVFLEKIVAMQPDALIVADPGVLGVIADQKINIPLHLSTQANVTSGRAAKWWTEQLPKLKRIILARELKAGEIADIVRQVPEQFFEVFIHGALCMSYSGRCNISNYLTGRDANQGDCSHCCRWNYRVYVEELTRPGQLMPVEEDERGSYFFSSRDLCLVGLLEELLATGVKSLKIEGRNKSIYYLAQVVRIYREALDDWQKDPTIYREKIPYYTQELTASTTRGYTTGFFGQAGFQMVNLELERVPREYEFVGLVQSSEGEQLKIEARNQIKRSDQLEIITPSGVFELPVEKFLSDQGEDLGEVVNTNHIFYLSRPVAFEVPVCSMIRKRS
jgi:U32 family peptidase